jgi:hypothetical protein
MVTETEDLRPTLQEVERYLKQEGFTIFYGYETARSRYLTVVVWEEEKSGWKGFLRAAKEAGTKVVVIQTSSAQQLQGMPPQGRPEETKSAEVATRLKRYLGKIGYIGLFWFKDGVKYSFSMSTDWWLQFSTVMATSYPTERGERLLEIPDDIRKKTEKELADELVAFVLKEFPDELDRMSFRASRLFWESKGLPDSWHLGREDPKIGLKLEKAESLAQFKLKQETQKREKQLVPKLVEECVNWAKENQMKRANKTNVDSFLAEKELTLSKSSRDIIYSKVNIILAR